VPPKTNAGERVVPLSGWLVAELTAHRERFGSEGLVFGTRGGLPLNPSNVRRDVWRPLKRRAGGSRPRPLLAPTYFRLAGPDGRRVPFNVARMMGHSRSTLVDLVNAHTMQSGMASVAENVTARALGVKPQVRVIEGGSVHDVREPLDETTPQDAKQVASG